MATDGVKIIDGDLARDTYNQIMDLYDSGLGIEVIRGVIPFERTELGYDTDFCHEIFVTAYALAFWEIGGLTDSILEEVKRVIDEGASVKVWEEEADEKAGKKRRKELDKLWLKISQPNQKIRKVKKYRKIVNLFFQENDVLVFKTAENYHAMICAKITQQRGQCSYDLVATTYKGKVKPTLDDLKSSFISGHKIGSGYGPDITVSYQPNVDSIWAYCGQSNFFFGLNYNLVVHKDMASFKEKFEVVGKLKIRDSFKKDAMAMNHHLRILRKYFAT